MMIQISPRGNWQPFLFLLLPIVTGSAWSQITVTGSCETGPLPFTPSWKPSADSLISGLSPIAANGNFGEYTLGNAHILTQAGKPLTLTDPTTPQAKTIAVCGNNGTAGSLLIYTLPESPRGRNLTDITVYGGWQDGGRDSQAYTVSYSTVEDPGKFLLLAQVNYSPPEAAGGMGSANRVVINDATGAVIARNVAALKFDFTTPHSENGAVGYTAITVRGTAAK